MLSLSYQRCCTTLSNGQKVTACRFREEHLDKEGRELADALLVGVGKLAGPLNQSVGQRR